MELILIRSWLAVPKDWGVLFLWMSLKREPYYLGSILCAPDFGKLPVLGYRLDPFSGYKGPHVKSSLLLGGIAWGGSEG